MSRKTVSEARGSRRPERNSTKVRKTRRCGYLPAFIIPILMLCLIVPSEIIMERSEIFIRPEQHNSPTDLIDGTGIKNPNLSPLPMGHGEERDTSREGSYLTRNDGSDEFRGMWCDGYKIVNESQIIELLEFARVNHFNTVSPLINTDDDGVYYESALYPKHEDVRPDFDPLMFLCIEAHKRGIEVHPWIHVLYNPYVGSDHPEWNQISDSGSRQRNWINPVIPEVRQHVLEMIMEMASYPLDGLRMDALRYKERQYSHDPYSNEAYASSGYSDRKQWQRDMLTELLVMINDELNGFKPYLWLSADVHWSYDYAWESRYQDIRVWTEQGLVDSLAIMDYTTNDANFRKYIADYVDNRHANLVYAGPYVYVPGNTGYGSVGTEEEGIGHLVTQIELAREVGAHGITIFKYELLRTHPNYAKALRSGPYLANARPPVLEQDHPVGQDRWEFDEQALREGWELFPRTNDHPLNGEWAISPALTGTKLVSPLLDIPPEAVTTLELRARNHGQYPLKMEFSWAKGEDITSDPQAEPVVFTLPPDGTFHILNKRLDTVSGWSGGTSTREIDAENISRIILTVISGGGEDTTLVFDNIRLLDIPICQKDWLLLGPFSNVDYEHALVNDHLRTGAENNNTTGGSSWIDPYPGYLVNGQEWWEFYSRRDYIDMYDQGHGLGSNVMYAFTYILAEKEEEYKLLVGANDGITVWINREIMISESRVVDEARPDEFQITTTLKKGLNTLLIKIAQFTTQFGLFVRITDLELRPVEDEVAFHPVLPPIPVPYPEDDAEGWTNNTTPLFRFDPVSINEPSSSLNISSYWWRVDSGPSTRIDVTSRDLLNGYLTVRLPEQENGIHIFRVCGQDALGRNGSYGEHEFMTDAETPVYGVPHPDKLIITSGEMISGATTVSWKWNVTRAPLSGISATKILVGSEPGKKDIGYLETIGTVLSFTLINISLEHELIHLTAVPVSGTGIEGPGTSSARGVIVDTEPPLKVPAISTDTILSADHTRIDRHDISWEPGKDMGSGIDHYLLEYTSQNLVEWYEMALVDSPNTTHRFENPERSERYRFRITAVDRAGNRGAVSDEYSVENLAPLAVIRSEQLERNDTRPEIPILVSANMSFDPDGCVTGHYWTFGDGTFSHAREAYHTYPYPGSYEISLTVYDDFGKHNRTTAVVEVEYGEPENRPDAGDENYTANGTDEGDDSEWKRPFMDVFEESPVSYMLLAILVLFIFLLVTIYFSKRVSDHRERRKIRQITSSGPGSGSLQLILEDDPDRGGPGSDDKWARMSFHPHVDREDTVGKGEGGPEGPIWEQNDHDMMDFPEFQR